MALTTYKQVRPWTKAIREVTRQRKMPPWFAETASLHFSNEAKLSERELSTIEEWAAHNAPEGTPPEQPIRLPPAQVFPPDLLLTMPQAVNVPAKGELEYQLIILPEPFPQERWVQAVEIRPGARGVVHHVVLYVRERGSSWLAGRPAGKAFVQPGPTTIDILAVYAPGQPPAVFPRGMAKKIPAGADLVLQIHYTSSGRAAQDRTQVALQFAKAKPERRVITVQIASTNFLIPAGEAGVRVAAAGTIPNDCLLLGLFPHMHLRGSAFEYALVEPGGHVETLLRVKPYNFHWQLYYRLAEPRLLKKGSRLRCTAWYDNSANNPLNPDPSEDVIYGEPSSAEMMVGFFDVAVPAEMDKNRFFVR